MNTDPQALAAEAKRLVQLYAHNCAAMAIAMEEPRRGDGSASEPCRLAREQFEQFVVIIDRLAALAALASKPDAAPEGRTGWPAGMLQDDSAELSGWLASKPDARLHAREAASEIDRQAFEASSFDFPPLTYGTLKHLAVDGAIPAAVQDYLRECGFAGWQARASSAAPAGLSEMNAVQGHEAGRATQGAATDGEASS